jgi:hypothetical protein
VFARAKHSSLLYWQESFTRQVMIGVLVLPRSRARGKLQPIAEKHRKLTKPNSGRLKRLSVFEKRLSLPGYKKRVLGQNKSNLLLKIILYNA